MKTILRITAISLILTFILNLQLQAGAFLLTDEAYIDDIPFNTEQVVENMAADSVSIDLADEQYIDDIPFDTRLVVKQYRSSLSMQVAFDFEDEPYINDIPFETEDIVKDYSKKEKNNGYGFFIFQDLKF